MIENGCKKGKINYTSKGARDAAAMMSNKKQKIHPYQCKACKAWHLSRMSGRNENGKDRKKKERYQGRDGNFYEDYDDEEDYF